MAGEPQHAAAEAPVARAAGDDDAIEPCRAHFRPDRGVTPRVFLRRELLVHRVAVIRRVAHHVERLVLVEPGFQFVPGERLGPRRRLHVCQFLQLPMVCRPPAFSTASLASLRSAICSKASFFSGSRSPVLMLFWCVHSVRARTKPSFTERMQFLVSTSIAYSTPPFGFCF